MWHINIIITATPAVDITTTSITTTTTTTTANNNNNNFIAKDNLKEGKQ